MSTPASVLGAAEAAFVAGQYRRAVKLAAQLQGGPLAARAAYVEGYALYKLRRLPAAAKALRRALAVLAPRVEARFLAGLVAFERRRWQLAVSTLSPLVEDPAWGKTSRGLIARAKSDQQASRVAAAAKRHAAAIDQLERGLRSGDLGAAERALKVAETARPRHTLNSYYRGYLAFKRGDPTSARREFRAVLARRPNDVWARYMLALTLDETKRRPLLQRVLRETKDAALRRAAQKALEVPKRPARHRLRVRVAVGSGYDSNPALANSSSTRVIVGPAAPPTDGTDTDETDNSALSLQVEAELGYSYTHGRHQLSLGLQGLGRGALAGAEGITQTELAAWLRYGLRLGRAWLQGSYGGSLYLFDHEAALSTHAFALQLALATPLSGLGVSATGQLRLRDAHAADYRYIQGLELVANVGLSYRRGSLTLGASYGALRGIYDPFSFDLGLPPGKPLPPTYAMDYTFWGHGPSLSINLALPWRLSFAANAWLLWQHFDQPETIIEPSGASPWSERRRDTQLIVRGELRRPLWRGLELALRYRLEHNGSTLSGDDVPIDRSYSRHLALLVLSYAFDLSRP
jgi:tetratricopeptide (TPR) repeat protein